MSRQAMQLEAAHIVHFAASGKLQVNQTLMCMLRSSERIYMHDSQDAHEVDLLCGAKAVAFNLDPH